MSPQPAPALPPAAPSLMPGLPSVPGGGDTFAALLGALLPDAGTAVASVPAAPAEIRTVPDPPAPAPTTSPAMATATVPAPPALPAGAVAAASLRRPDSDAPAAGLPGREVQPTIGQPAPAAETAAPAQVAEAVPAPSAPPTPQAPVVSPPSVPVAAPQLPLPATQPPADTPARLPKVGAAPRPGRTSPLDDEAPAARPHSRPTDETGVVLAPPSQDAGTPPPMEPTAILPTTPRRPDVPDPAVVEQDGAQLVPPVAGAATTAGAGVWAATGAGAAEPTTPRVVRQPRPTSERDQPADARADPGGTAGDAAAMPAAFAALPILPPTPDVLLVDVAVRGHRPAVAGIGDSGAPPPADPAQPGAAATPLEPAPAGHADRSTPDSAPDMAPDTASASAPALTAEAPATPTPAHLPSPPALGEPRSIADTTTPALRAAEPPARQVAPALVAIIRAPEGGDRIVLRLEPRDLGQVELRVERPADAPVQVHVSAEKPETLALLVADRPRLEQALDQAGMAAHGRDIVFHLAVPEPPRETPMGWGDPPPRGGFMATTDGGSGQAGGSPGQRQRPEGAPGWSPSPTPDDGPTPTWLRAGLDITA